MNTVIEIKAATKEEAIRRALKITEALEENIVKIVEKKKGISILGLSISGGLYEIEIDKNKVIKKESTEVLTNNKVKDLSGKEEEPKVRKEINNSSKESTKIEIKSEEEKFKEVKTEKRDEIENFTEIIKEKSQILLDKMNLNLSVTVSKIYERTYIVNLYGEDNGIIIGKKGKTLNSFEYFLNSLFKRCRIEVDVEGFKEKRYDTLRDLAKKMAEKVVKTRKTLRLNPMPAKERKIIHEVINTYEVLNTFSEGKDPKRYIVIKYKK
jgi:Predicted RNA-binding protein